MRALITGGTGFIGSHLADALLRRGHEVVALDDLSTGNPGNIRHLLDDADFQFVRGSVLDAYTVNEHVSDCDCVYHLAAAVGVELIFGQPVRTIETNVRGTQIVLEAAVRHRRKVFVASTSEVYGKDVRVNGGRFRESDDVTFGVSARWCYASSKALDEYLARAYYIEKGLPVVIGRFFNTVGPRQSAAYGMVVPRFVGQALAGKPITVYGDGTQVRSFGWVGDVVRGTCALMERRETEGEIYNIGSDEAITIRGLAERVKTLTQSRSEIVYVPHADVYGAGFEDIRYRTPDLTKIRAAVGYRPTKTLDEILRHVIDYFTEGNSATTRAPAGEGLPSAAG